MAYKMVHAMITRVYAAGLAAVLCFGSVLAPNEAFARFGGFGGRSFAFHSGFHAPASRTPFLAHRSAFGFDRLRRQAGLVPLTVLGGSAYGPSDYIDPYLQPVAAEPEIVTGAIPGGLSGVRRSSGLPYADRNGSVGGRREARHQYRAMLLGCCVAIRMVAEPKAEQGKNHVLEDDDRDRASCHRDVRRHDVRGCCRLLYEKSVDTSRHASAHSVALEFASPRIRPGRQRRRSDL